MFAHVGRRRGSNSSTKVGEAVKQSSSCKAKYCNLYKKQTGARKTQNKTLSTRKQKSFNYLYCSCISHSLQLNSLYLRKHTRATIRVHLLAVHRDGCLSLCPTTENGTCFLGKNKIPDAIKKIQPQQSETVRSIP